jgi:hypothetical protein
MVHLKILALSTGASNTTWRVTYSWVDGVRFSRETSVSWPRHIILLNGPFKDIGVIHRSLHHNLAGDLQLGRWVRYSRETSLFQPRHIILLHGPLENIGVIHWSLQHSLAGDLQLGRRGEVQRGDTFVLALAYNLITWSS